MNLKEAFEIVLDLASQGMLTDDECDDAGLRDEQNPQSTAIQIVEDWYEEALPRGFWWLRNFENERAF